MSNDKIQAYLHANWRLLCLFSFKYFLKHLKFRKLGNITRMFPSFSYSIFSHMSHFDQSCTSKNNWLNIITDSLAKVIRNVLVIQSSLYLPLMWKKHLSVSWAHWFILSDLSLFRTVRWNRETNLHSSCYQDCISTTCSLTNNGRCEGFIVSALVSSLSDLGSSPSWGHCVVFLSKTLHSHSGPLQPGV